MGYSSDIKSRSRSRKTQKEIVIEREVQEELLAKNLEEIKNKTITIKVKADEKGHLFSAIHEKMIVEVMEKEYHARIDEKFIVLEKQIKEIGNLKSLFL